MSSSLNTDKDCDITQTYPQSSKAFKRQCVQVDFSLDAFQTKNIIHQYWRLLHGYIFRFIRAEYDQRFFCEVDTQMFAYRNIFDLLLHLTDSLSCDYQVYLVTCEAVSTHAFSALALQIFKLYINQSLIFILTT